MHPPFFAFYPSSSSCVICIEKQPKYHLQPISSTSLIRGVSRSPYQILWFVYFFLSWFSSRSPYSPWLSVCVYWSRFSLSLLFNLNALVQRLGGRHTGEFGTTVLFTYVHIACIKFNTNLHFAWASHKQSISSSQICCRTVPVCQWGLSMKKELKYNRRVIS